MRVYYLPIREMPKEPHGKLVWIPHLILRSSRGRYLVNVFFMDKIAFSPRKALLISPYSGDIIEGHPPPKEGTIIDVHDFDPERIIDDLGHAYIESSEIAKSKAYHRAKFWGRFNLKRIILIPTGFLRTISEDEALAEEFREASYGAMILRETIFWRGERPIVEGLVYVPIFLIKERDGVVILDRDLRKNKILMELIKKEESVHKAIKRLVEEY
ncbi:MAG: hypothetical protein DRN30_01680 [Thermoplasmata archaeon]|nr:MAG: hypothetical protein DRN30_01680 [Thermoplasmata archaeon]